MTTWYGVDGDGSDKVVRTGDVVNMSEYYKSYIKEKKLLALFAGGDASRGVVEGASQVGGPYFVVRWDRWPRMTCVTEDVEVLGPSGPRLLELDDEDESGPHDGVVQA